MGPKVDNVSVIEEYEQEALLALINKHQHLNRVAKIDECQLIKDIEACATSSHCR